MPRLGVSLRAEGATTSELRMVADVFVDDEVGYVTVTMIDRDTRLKPSTARRLAALILAMTEGMPDPES